MNNLITIENVKGYLDPVTGTAYLNAEDVARGFGFTTVAKSGNAVIRWARVNRYLSEFGLSKEIGRDDYILKNRSLVTITQIAKDYGMSGQAMNKILHNLGIIYNQSGQWLLYSRHQARGYTHSETVSITHADGREAVKMNTKWTQKGRLFLYDTLKKEDIVPVIERGA